MKKNLIEGFVKRHPDGFGFLIPDSQDHPDVFIPKHGMDGIMTNDRVLVEVHREKGFERFRGEIVRVTKRFFAEVLGRFHKTGEDTGCIFDEGHGWGANLKIKKGDTLNAKDGDFVRIKILTYPSPKEELTGKVVELLGRHDDPLLDVKKVIFASKIPTEFSQACIQEAKQLPKTVRPEDMQGRKDLTGLNLITIDGVTAKDFDDAIYVEQQRDGFRVWVAIADVSHYVKPGKPLDKDAFERGNSTYFPNYVVPMLPEELSNELCSLKPDVIRLSLVAEMLVNFTGDLTKYEFYEAFIKSKARVTYGEAQEVIDGNCPDKLKHVKDNILRANDLAKLLLAQRMKNGSLQLDIPETQVVLNDLGEPIDLIRSERIFAHQLIEELMLLANVAVAKFFKDSEIDAIYRIHEPPRQEAIQLLNKYLLAFGASKQILGGSLQKKLTQALEKMRGTPQEEILNVLTLRSMNQAQYSPNNVGHFGLGFSDYTHFTSPIRRYPDLIVHRLLKAILYRGKGYSLVPEDQLATAGTHLSGCEQRSAKCERSFYSIKKARFMKPHLGSEFEGVVSSVTKFGIFVLLREFDVDGLVKLDELGGDYFEFDEDNLRLVGKRTGLAYEIGMPIKIQVLNVDIDGGRIDFGLAEGFEPKGRIARSKLAKSSHHERLSGYPKAKAKGGRFDRPAKGDKHSKPNKSNKADKDHRSKHERVEKPARVESGDSNVVKSRFKNLADYLNHRKGSSEANKNGSPDRSHNQKRSETTNDRGGVRQARVRKRR